MRAHGVEPKAQCSGRRRACTGYTVTRRLEVRAYSLGYHQSLLVDNPLLVGDLQMACLGATAADNLFSLYFLVDSLHELVSYQSCHSYKFSSIPEFYV